MIKLTNKLTHETITLKQKRALIQNNIMYIFENNKTKFKYNLNEYDYIIC